MHRVVRTPAAFLNALLYIMTKQRSNFIEGVPGNGPACFAHYSSYYSVVIKRSVATYTTNAVHLDSTLAVASQHRPPSDDIGRRVLAEACLSPADRLLREPRSCLAA